MTMENMYNSNSLTKPYPNNKRKKFKFYKIIFLKIDLIGKI